MAAEEQLFINEITWSYQVWNYRLREDPEGLSEAAHMCLHYGGDNRPRWCRQKDNGAPNGRCCSPTRLRGWVWPAELDPGSRPAFLSLPL